MLLDVISVQPQPGYKLRIEFENHERRIFDMSPYLDIGVFRNLKDPAYFSSARIEGGTVAWPGEIDIAPETLYVESTPIS